MENPKVVRDHDLTDIVVKRLKHVFGITEVVNWKALTIPFGQHVAEDCGVYRVESQ